MNVTSTQECFCFFFTPAIFILRCFYIRYCLSYYLSTPLSRIASSDIAWRSPPEILLFNFDLAPRLVPHVTARHPSYEEQKRRLKLSGLRRPIYLVEGNVNHQSILAPATLRTALASSQACGGLAVVQCNSLRDSVDFLARTHRHIASLLLDTCRCSSRSGRGELWPGGDVDGGGGGVGRGGAGVGAILRPAMTYGEYAQGCAKRAGETTVKRLLGAMARQVPGCSAARAQALIQEFESPLGLMLALERAAGGGCEGPGSDDATRMKRVDDLLTGLACRGRAGASKLPQPLRLLLCRLFLGESVDGADDGAGADAGGEQHLTATRQDSSRAAGLSRSNPYREWDVEPMSQDDPYL